LYFFIDFFHNFILPKTIVKLKSNLDNFELKTPFDGALEANTCSMGLLLLDAFRTIDWKKVKEELEIFKSSFPCQTASFVLK